MDWSLLWWLETPAIQAEERNGLAWGQLWNHLYVCQALSQRAEVSTITHWGRLPAQSLNYCFANVLMDTLCCLLLSPFPKWHRWTMKLSQQLRNFLVTTFPLFAGTIKLHCLFKLIVVVLNLVLLNRTWTQIFCVALLHLYNSLGRLDESQLLVMNICALYLIVV